METLLHFIHIKKGGSLYNRARRVTKTESEHLHQIFTNSYPKSILINKYKLQKMALLVIVNATFKRDPQIETCKKYAYIWLHV